MRDVILTPVYNDWESVHQLLFELDSVLADAGFSVEILLVDDGSQNTFHLVEPLSLSRGGVACVRLLQLRRNLGHQRAIAVGLGYLASQESVDRVVIMDSDGEDNPADVPRLLAEVGSPDQESVVFAQRTRRSESWKFRLGYWLYRQLFRILTGHTIRFGNFSAFSARVLARLVAVSEVWNHYSSAVLKARIPCSFQPTARGRRYAGRSRMGLQQLILHGLSSLAVFADTVALRLFLSALVASGILLIMLVIVVGLRLLTDLAIPGWTSTVGGILLVLLVQMLGISGVALFMALHTRSQVGAIPSRDWTHFRLCEKQLWPPLEAGGDAQ